LKSHEPRPNEKRGGKKTKNEKGKAPPGGEQIKGGKKGNNYRRGITRIWKFINCQK